MFHRSLALLGALVALLVATPALAADVTVRVEGKTQTLFGTERPLVSPFVGTLTAEDSAGTAVPVELTRPTPLGALEAASRAGELYYHLTAASFGNYVDQVGRFGGAGSAGWVYKVNGKSPSAAADALVLEDGDEVLWYYATFGETGGPLTLEIRLEPKTGCLLAVGRDDAGKARRVTGVTFELSTGVVRSRSGRTCPAAWNSARVVKKGAIRSATLLAG